MTMIILGWDGLDYDRAENFNLLEEFGEYNKKINTFDNSVLSKPHTYEIWPSIITGLTPDEHGIHSDDYTEGMGWSNPLLNVASIVSKYTIPDNFRWMVGRKIREGGFTFDMKSERYYTNNNLETIFNGKRSLSIAVPNHRTNDDEELNVLYDRGAQLSEFLNIDTDENGNTIHRPKVDLKTLEQRLNSEVGQKIGIVRAALEQDYDIIFVWIGYLDTVGHLGPAIENNSWIKEKYEIAAEWTQMIKSAMDEQDTLLCVSDHGLKDGSHTHDPYIGSNLESVTTIDNVFEIKPWVDKNTSNINKSINNTTKNNEAENVKEQLEDLGYI